MAIAISSFERHGSIGTKRQHSGTITFDSSYPTGGEAVTAANFGLSVMDHLQFNQGEDGYVFHWDKANAKIIAYEAGADGAPLDEVADTTDLSSVVVEAIATGR